jgi:transcriptional regulator with XRE-family HTH domain
MNTLRYIRKTIFGMTQKEFAAAIGATQPTVCRWELPDDRTDRLAPSRDEMAAVRRLAAERGIAWDDRWFFEQPSPLSEAGEGDVRPGAQSEPESDIDRIAVNG